MKTELQKIWAQKNYERVTSLFRLHLPPFLSDVLLTYYLSKELCQTLKKKPFAKIVNSFQSLEVVKRIKSSEVAVNKSNKI